MQLLEIEAGMTALDNWPPIEPICPEVYASSYLLFPFRGI